MKTVKNIIFDLGGVLIDWNPEYVYLDVFDGDRKKMQWFFDEICTFDWNENQDAGYPLAQATADRIALFPQYEEWIKMFYGRWEGNVGWPHRRNCSPLKKTGGSSRLQSCGTYKLECRNLSCSLEKV
jgi:2-haloacid dehalogenase